MSTLKSPLIKPVSSKAFLQVTAYYTNNSFFWDFFCCDVRGSLSLANSPTANWPVVQVQTKIGLITLQWRINARISVSWLGGSHGPQYGAKPGERAHWWPLGDHVFTHWSQPGSAQNRERCPSSHEPTTSRRSQRCRLSQEEPKTLLISSKSSWHECPQDDARAQP